MSVTPVVIPDEAGVGHPPQSFVKAASERIRSGLSPKASNISATVWAGSTANTVGGCEGVGGLPRENPPGAECGW